jgi:hypothetical protein
MTPVGSSKSSTIRLQLAVGGRRRIRMAKFDPRGNADYEELMAGLSVRYPPLVGVSDLREVKQVLAVLPDLEFPVNSAGELIEKLGGPDQNLRLVGITVEPLRMIKYMPSYYFPIASMENFIEKMAELIRDNRKQVNVPEELARIKEQLPTLRFPIDSPEDLLRITGANRVIRFQGGPVDPQQIMRRLPQDFFPINSEEEFDSKVAQLMMTRPLIVGE